MDSFFPALLLVLTGYLLGSLSFAIAMSRWFGLADPRTYGSGNPGATNVLRSGNKLAAGLTLLGDAAKGWFAIWIAQHFAPQYGLAHNGDLVALVGLAAFVGHLFPLFHRFIGGKGVATALGILLGINPLLGIATLATWLIVALFFRTSSLAAIVAALFAPFYDAVLYGLQLQVLIITLISALIIWRHKNNLKNLTAGTETRIGDNATHRDNDPPK
ncbi:MAG: glycerol-3-phosphate 1-O-acyltransferase PlsY [Ottowia sp.]|nr:glycerol-3-phosphate 1-O-acyltransferase PlsY [Ottowia sp.]